MNAIKAGITAYRQEALIPLEELGWDEYGARLYRYNIGDLYYNNAIYKNLRGFNATAVNRKIDSRLYKRIRGIYNPVYRLAESYVSKVYGGELDLDQLSSGAFPVVNAEDPLRLAIKQQLIHSQWRVNKSLFVRQCSKYGDVFLKVVDDTAVEKVRTEILHPGKVKDFKKDSDGRVTEIIIEYERLPEDEPYKPKDNFGSVKQSYLYTEIITGDSFSFYKDGELYDYVNDVKGGQFAQYANDYGFVPVKHIMHRDEGLQFGASAFNNSLDKIDELNQQASLLNDAIQRNVDLPYMFVGISKPNDKTVFSSDEKDDLKGIYLPTATPQMVDAKPLPSNLNIADTIINIERLQAEIERDMPELAMHRLRESANQTAPGIRAAYNDAVDRFQEAQGIYDSGVTDAFNMAIAIGGLRRYPNYQGFGLDDYLKGNFEWFVKPRAIIDDELSKNERITALVSSQAPPRWVWKELGIAEEEIETAEQEAEERRQEMMEFTIGDNSDDENTP
jgi:hypothetical protein